MEPLPGRLTQRLGVWEREGVSGVVKDWLERGFPLPGIERVTSRMCQQRWRRMWHLKWAVTEDLDLELHRLQEIGVIRRCWERTLYMSPIFGVPKPDGRVRLIFNLRALNRWLDRPPRFRCEDLTTLKDLIRKEDWMAKVDLSDAYLHLPIRAEHQQYLAFWWRQEVWCYNSLPFGLAWAPWTFTKLMREVENRLHREGLRVICYLDDALILAQSREDATKALNRLKEALQDRGFLVNTRKSSVEVSQTVIFLGLEINSVEMSVRVPSEKWSKLREELLTLPERPRLSLRQWAAIIGKLQALSPATAGVMARLRPLLRTMRSGSFRLRSWDSQIGALVSAQELKELVDALCQWNGKALCDRPADFYITTDAAEEGWGAWLGPAADASRAISQCHGRWSAEERAQSNNFRELLALWYGCQALGSGVPQQGALCLQTDNTAAFFYVQGQGGSVPSLSRIAEDIWKWALDRKILLSARWIPGQTNELADEMSRVFVDRTDWSLNPRWFAMAVERWGVPDIDLFASQRNRQVPRFFSAEPQPESEGVDAFRQDWARFRLVWANPPWSYIPKVIRQMEESRVKVILVAPLWIGAKWFPQLLDHAEDMLILPMDPDVLLPAHDGIAVPTRQYPWRILLALLSPRISRARALVLRRQISAWIGGQSPP